MYNTLLVILHIKRLSQVLILAKSEDLKFISHTEYVKLKHYLEQKRYYIIISIINGISDWWSLF